METRIPSSRYEDYLRSPQWRATRARYFASDQPQDCICGETEHLQLHHLTYERLGHEELTDLTPLCDGCHRMVHVLNRRGEIGLDFSGFVSAKRAEDYAEQQVGMERRRMEGQQDRDLEQRRRITMGLLDQIKREAKRQIKAGENPVPMLDALLADLRSTYA